MNTSLRIHQLRFRPPDGDDSPFPEYQRVIYAKNPIELVICQLRFPPILKIGAAAPADFQDSIRKEYPLYREVPSLSLGAGLPPEVSNIVNVLPIPMARAHEFTSEDQSWAVTLTQESLALTCANYERWERFREHLQPALRALAHLYEPPFFTRIGLRYRDLIDRKSLGLEAQGWETLLSRDFACEFHSPIAPLIENLTHQVVVKLQDAARVTIQHGLVPKNDEMCYVIDSDFYVAEKTEAGDAVDILNYFNRQAGRLFRWLISEQLHRAMEPASI